MATRSRIPISPCPEPPPRSGAVVGYLQFDVVVSVTDRHPGRTGVLEGVGQRLLHDAVSGEFYSGRERPGLALDVQLYRQSGLAHLPDQLVEVVEARLGRKGKVRVRVAQHTEQAAHLYERLAPGRLDRAQYLLAVSRLFGLREALGRLRLYHHHAHAVGHHVVQLAGDARPLLCNSGPCLFHALALEYRGALQELLGLVSAAAHPPAEGPHARDEEPCGHHFAEGVSPEELGGVHGADRDRP
jgi:hypothetical protein